MNPVILVVEDELAIADLISINLELSGYRVMHATSAEAAMPLLAQELPDLALLDWMLPGISGLEFSRKLREDSRTKSLPIILLTAKGEEENKIRGLGVGADDYVTKPFSVRELEARIKAVLRRRAPQMTDDIVKYHGLILDPSSRKITGKRDEINLPLTMGPTEYRLLHFFMTHTDRVYSRLQLLDLVWGDHIFIEERTVDVHIRRLRSALQPSGHDVLVQTVRSAGYRFSIDA